MGRMQKVNQLVKREISQVIQQELRDPRTEFVTITDVEVSPDLRHARVSYSVLGGPQRVDEAAESLSHASGYVRKRIGQKVNLRYTPEIEFVYDRSIEQGARLDKVLDELKIEREGRGMEPETG